MKSDARNVSPINPVTMMILVINVMANRRYYMQPGLVKRNAAQSKSMMHALYILRYAKSTCWTEVASNSEKKSSS